MDPPRHRDDLAPDAMARLEAVRRRTLDEAVELLRPGTAGGRERSGRIGIPRNAQWLLTHVPRARGGVVPGETHLAALHDHWDELLSSLVG